jgi:hypothetical protein
VPPKFIEGKWIGRAALTALRSGIDFEQQFQAARKKLGRKARHYAMTMGGEIVPLK